MQFNVFFSLVLSFALVAGVSAHTAVEPMLGVVGTPQRNKDIFRTTPDAPCGPKIKVTQDVVDSSNAVTSSPDGSFVVTAVNFNGGTDGSRAFDAIVDPTATGQTFLNATVIKNGDPNPKNNAPEDLTVQLPVGVNCTGGSTGDLCLVAFKQAPGGAGFGNCVVVRHQGAVEQRFSIVSGASATGSKTASSASAAVTSAPNSRQATASRSASAATGPATVTVTVTRTIHDGQATSDTAITSTQTVVVTKAKDTATGFHPLTRSSTALAASVTSKSSAQSSAVGKDVETKTSGLFHPTGSQVISFSSASPAASASTTASVKAQVTPRALPMFRLHRRSRDAFKSNLRTPKQRLSANH